MRRPYDATDLDYFFLAGKRSPGRAVFANHNLVLKWDEKDADGQDGTTNALKGRKIAKPTVTIYLEQDIPLPGQADVYAEAEAFIQHVLSLIPNSGPPTAVQISHPDLARLRITEVAIESVSGLTYDGLGGCSFSIQFTEFRPAKPKAPATAKAKASTGSTGGGREKPDPNAQAKAELRALTEEALRP